MAGEDFEPLAASELGLTGMNEPEAKPAAPSTGTDRQPPQEEYTAIMEPERVLTPEEKLKQAMCVPCPITKFSGKTLGEVLSLDPGAIKWVATKFTGNEAIRDAAKLICEYAAQQATA
ncbi:MAG: hypothetical protein HDT26_01080 [Subdoligranulum sp.]|nr:hypothetical protein [Subdoligranulum sp.]